MALDNIEQLKRRFWLIERHERVKGKESGKRLSKKKARAPLWGKFDNTSESVEPWKNWISGQFGEPRSS
jgi:hypothetical protein